MSASPVASSSPQKTVLSQPITEYEFVSEVTDDVSCSICLSVLVQPNLTDCCGNHFCRACIARVKEDGMPCPLCQEPSFTTMLNKSLSRKLNQLEVKCPNASEGCSWTGELAGVDKHAQDLCEFLEVPCDFGCGENIIRRYLAEHKSKACKERLFACEHCQLQDTWSTITQDHYPVCDKYPVPCPNQCDVGEIDRKQLEDHMSSCPLQVINCTFQFAGCKVSLPRRDMQQHVSDNMASHLTLGFQTFQQQLSAKDNEIAKLKETVASLKVATDDEIATLKETVESLRDDQQISAATGEFEIMKLKSETERQSDRISTLEEEVERPRFSALGAVASNDDHRTYPPCSFTMTNVKHYKHSNMQWFSDPFYSHEEGYKMCLSVFANGTGAAYSSYISVYVNLMRGEYDDELRWPFRASIGVRLDLDDATVVEDTCKFNARSSKKAVDRVNWGDRQVFGQGVLRFVSLDKLTGDDSKFLDFQVCYVQLNF